MVKKFWKSMFLKQELKGDIFLPDYFVNFIEILFALK